MKPVVNIIMGSTSDLPVMEKAARFFDEMEIPFEMNALSAHRTPDEVEQFAKGEMLDLRMETFPYSDGTDAGLLRTYDREWRIDLDALHYKFELRVWVTIPEDGVKMETMDYDERLKDG